MIQTSLAPRLFALLVICLIGPLAGLAGCASAPGGPSDEAAVAQTGPEVGPGAERWTGAALRLPAGSPAVVVAAPDALLTGLGELKAWVVAEPAMFGEDGEALVEAIASYWAVSTGILGADPASAAAWAGRGVDVSRKIYGGLYPIDEPGRRFVAEVDAGLRQAFAIPPEVDLLEGLDPDGDAEPAAIPAGVNAEILRRVKSLEPVLGARLLVPTTDAMLLIGGISDAALATGFRPVSPEQEEAMGLGAAGRAFVGEGAARPAFAMRAGEAYVTIDMVLPLYRGAAQRAGAGARDEAALEEALVRAVTTPDAGRPAAPRPLGDPALALSFHQPSMARLVRLRGYRSVLQELQSAGASRRDAQLVSELDDVLMHARSWELRADALQGIVYALSLGSPQRRRVAALTLTLFGEESLPGLTTSDPARSLGISRRAVGLSLDVSPFFDAAWQAWFGVDDPQQAFDDLDGGETDPFVFFAMMPRNLIVLAGNLAKAKAEGFAPEVAPLVERLRHVARVEVVSPTPDLSGFYTRPRFTAVVSLEPSATAAERDAAAVAARDALAGMVAEIVGAPTPANAPDELAPGEVASFVAVPGQPPLHYLYQPEGDAPFIAFDVGRDPAAARAELDALGEAAPVERPDAAFARVEPVALLSLLTAVDPKRFEPLDVRILAQRLGPILLEVRPEEVEGAKVVRWVLELQRPPEL